MSHIQSGSRRHSARLQQKEENDYSASAATTNGKHVATAPTTKVQTSATNTRKRKNNYDEDDDGFVFSRVKKPKPRQSTSAQQDQPPRLPTLPEAEKPALSPSRDKQHASDEAWSDKHGAPTAPPQKRRNRMSFSTPGTKDQQPTRRSKRLSTEAQDDRGSPIGKPAQQLRIPKIRKEKVEKQKPPAQHSQPPPQDQPHDNRSAAPERVPLEDSHASTKIALPFADTPVISRNKAMRDRKSGKGERRSSLGLRGRRASSLIDSGTSNGMFQTWRFQILADSCSIAARRGRSSRLLQAYRE